MRHKKNEFTFTTEYNVSKYIFLLSTLFGLVVLSILFTVSYPKGLVGSISISYWKIIYTA